MIDIDPNAAAKREIPAIWAEFYTEEVPDEEATKTAGHVIYKSVDKARWGRRGQNLNVLEEPIRRMMKNPPVWDVLRPHYEAWKKNQEAPLTGTPLKMWPAIAAAQARTLQGVGIRTVEELMELTDGDADRIGFGYKNLRNRARAWKAAAQDVGRVAEENESLKVAMAQMQERLADLERGNAELHAAIQAKGAPVPDAAKRKAG